MMKHVDFFFILLSLYEIIIADPLDCVLTC